MMHADAITEAFATFRAGLAEAEAALATPDMQATLGQAIDLLLGIEGRLIVTGMGKSGHVARKLAATFASTGTPASFVHPAEASHGDLGMIRRDDAVLMLSWGGETRELRDLLAYSRRFRIPLMLITGTAESTLGRAADIVLPLPGAREACPHNLAPTTSTMLQLALGDALAVATLKARGFTEDSFHAFHPGGKLGASLTAVRELMHGADALPVCAPDDPVIAVIAALSRRNLGIVGILDGGGALQGVVTDGDIRRYLERSSESTMQAAMHQTRAAGIMTRDPVSLPPGMLSARALDTMQKRRISAAFVLEDGKPVGLLTTLQLLQAGVA